MDAGAIDVPVKSINPDLRVDPLEPRIKAHLAAWLESAGVNRDFVVKAFSRVDGALDAEHVRRIVIEGKVVGEFRDPDHVTRLKAVDRALDLASRAGVIPSGRVSGSKGSSPQINVSIQLLSSSGEERVVPIVTQPGEQGR